MVEVSDLVVTSATEAFLLLRELESIIQSSVGDDGDECC